MFHLGYQIENHQIALDNASIVLGRGRRAFFNRIEQLNRTLNQLENAHHLIHACALDPLTAAECLSLDQAAENNLMAFVQTSHLLLKAEWSAIKKRSAQQMEQEHVRYEINAIEIPPFYLTKCPICFQYNHFEITGQKFLESISTPFFSRKLSNNIEVFAKGHESSWGYRLLP
jgi:hypothetical protein